MAKEKLGQLATPEAQARGDKFLRWFSQAMPLIRGKWLENCNEDAMQDAALRVYDAILYRELRIRVYRAYYMMTYCNECNKAKASATSAGYLDSVTGEYFATDEPVELSIADEDTDAATDWHDAVDTLGAEVLAYVNEHYDPVQAAIFEIYMGLLPDTSYRKLAQLLGFPFNTIWRTIGAIQADVRVAFGERKNKLLHNL